MRRFAPPQDDLPTGPSYGRRTMQDERTNGSTPPRTGLRVSESVGNEGLEGLIGEG